MQIFWVAGALNLIKDSKVVIEDTILAKKVYCSNARSLKELFAILKLATAASNIAEILGELINANEESKLSADRHSTNDDLLQLLLQMTYFAG